LVRNPRAIVLADKDIRQMRPFYTQMTLIIGGLGLLAACSEDPPPRSVTEFIEKPLMLEAAMVRCLQDRVGTRYDAECVNARQAAQLIEAREDRSRRDELEARSLHKRQALRRTQSAAIEARRRALENERLRTDAEYVAQFGVVSPSEGEILDGETLEGGQELESGLPTDFGEPREQRPRGTETNDYPPATDGGNAPMMSTAPEEDEPQNDLETVRDQLQRLKDDDGS
jgi:hypothetical protein